MEQGYIWWFACSEMGTMLKVKPADGYPPEEGRYLRGKDFSPVAVCAILAAFGSAIPPELNEMVVAGVDAGAAIFEDAMVEHRTVGGGALQRHHSPWSSAGGMGKRDRRAFGCVRRNPPV